MSGGGSGATTQIAMPQEFKLIDAQHYDVLVCERRFTVRRPSWPVDLAAYPMKILKAFALRRIPFEGRTGITGYNNREYFYSDHTHRSSTRVDTTEYPFVETVDPPYVTNDHLLAVPVSVDPGVRTNVECVAGPSTPDFPVDSNLLVRLSGGSGTFWPQVPYYGTWIFWDWRHFVFPEMIIHYGGRQLRGQVVKNLGNDDADSEDSTLVVQPNHGIAIGDIIPKVAWSHQYVQAAQGQRWQQGLKNVLIWFMGYSGVDTPPGLRNFFDRLLAFTNARVVSFVFDVQHGPFTGNIHDYSLVFYSSKTSLRDEDVPPSWAGPIFDGTWKGRIVMIGSSNSSDLMDPLNESINELTDIHDMSVDLDAANYVSVPDAGQADIVADHRLTNNLPNDWLEIGRTKRVAIGADAIPLLEAKGFPSSPSVDYCLGENTVDGISWVVAGGKGVFRESNPEFITNLYTVPVGGG